MKERPILFSAPMVRALLEGRKTKTRRIIKPQPQVTEQRLRELGGWIQGMTLSEQVNAAWQAGFVDVKCPHGKPGDRLWVREKWAARGKHTDSYSIAEISANRSHFEIWYADSCIRNGREQFNTDFLGKWRPSIFMPRNLSRILLEITEVRVERLQDISEADAKAEGVSPAAEEPFRDACGELVVPAGRYRNGYRDLWESINGPGSWDANPWVWVIQFCKIEG